MGVAIEPMKPVGVAVDPKNAVDDAAVFHLKSV